MFILDLIKNKAECVDLLSELDKMKEFISHKIDKSSKDLERLSVINKDILKTKGFKLTIEKYIQICSN